MLHYLKFANYFLSTMAGVTAILFAQHWILLGFAIFVVFYVLGDAFFGEDLSQPELNNKALLNIMLYASVPTTMLLLAVSLWLVTPYDWAIMQWLSATSAYDFIAAKEATNAFEIGVALVFCGLMLSGVATVVGHELIHRIGNKKAVTTGRWLLAISFDASFSIEHVFNHHVHVATEKDPVTAKRGTSVYAQVPLAIIRTSMAAWQIEKKRLTRKKQSIFSFHNQYITGWLMSVAWLSLATVLGGWQGLLFVTGVGIAAKVILEIVNYMEHYGLVRHPREPVRPRHSWNNNRRISCWAMFNLPRHSHHHAKGAVPFEKLEAMPDAPIMIGGYISTMLLVLIPPLWFSLMRPKLQHWDKTMANEKELEIIAQQAQDAVERKEKRLALIKSLHPMRFIQIMLAMMKNPIKGNNR
ncbi:alkane 1-monooxygenase [Glaciecola sp. MH2013]|uniref:alkane 1-monooxygenase n=1 Tax=Glaciecola sp. MH2013 TaxID=2785524 RepID=UPI00189F486F|nr:alkane 1-monooxygenase [Glaciecola sp. MH2013]MBF7072952.1 alkane 1-monooxygenase [Glaciecola sp. MH2013]